MITRTAWQNTAAAELIRYCAWLQADLELARTKWLPDLKATVAQISEKFSDNFARIGSVGEVSLYEEGENFANYSIQIRVKFRESEALEVRALLVVRLCSSSAVTAVSSGCVQPTDVCDS